MGESESEDSESEGSMGNVSRVVIRPPGHSGKAKKGHLCFDASFETGNLGSVELVSSYEYDLFIRPDTCNPRLRLWFHFTIDNTKPDQRVLLNLINFGCKRNVFRYGMTPLVKSTSKPIWQRMPRNNVFYHSSPYHNNNYILSLAFTFDREEDVYTFAFCYPYSYTKCQAHLDNLENRNMPHFKRETLGYSLLKRRVDVITITHPKNMVPDKKLHAIIIMSRIHAGESPSSYVCQGFIDFLISNHPVAESLRENVIFKIMPMINPDGVFLGNYRCSQVGADLNQALGKLSKYLHPTLFAAYTYITNIDQDKNIQLDFVLDLHCHSLLRGAFVYGNTYNDVYRYERHIVFPKLLAQNILGFEAQHSHFNKNTLQADSIRRVLCNVLTDTVNCYSFHVSFFGYHNHKKNSFQYYTEETYYKVGRNLVETFYDYYKVVGLLGEEGRAQPQRNVVRHQPRPTSTPLAVKLEKIKRPTYGKLKLYEMEILSPIQRKVHKLQSRKSRRKQRSGWVREPLDKDLFNPSLTIVDFNTMTLVPNNVDK